MPSIFVGLAFGRLGCFMNGCCYGERTVLPWGISFPVGSVPDMALVLRGIVAPDETIPVLLHPSQLYSSLNALILACLTHWYFKHRRRDGILLGIALLAYPVMRFIIEILRGDEPVLFDRVVRMGSNQLESGVADGLGQCLLHFILGGPAGLVGR